MQPVSHFPSSKEIRCYWISFSALMSSSSRSQIVSGCGDEGGVLYISELAGLFSVSIWGCVVFGCSSCLSSSWFEQIVFVGWVVPFWGWLRLRSFFVAFGSRRIWRIYCFVTLLRLVEFNDAFSIRRV